MMKCDYPLRFEPIFRRYLWGGRKLNEFLGKRIGEGSDYAESWEIVDRGPDQSIVTHGPLAGRSLGGLMQDFRNDLLGPQWRADQSNGSGQRFPLLFKFLDAQHDLSVQVHPNDQQAARITPPDFGKTEAWVVLAAEPGSVLYAGLRADIDRRCLEEAVHSGQCAECLHRVEPRVGECYFLPAGSVHAIGAGLLIAEIQQSSDVTYRLFDWNRTDASGKPRPLHVEQALDVTDFARGPISAQQETALPTLGVSRLVTSEPFVLNRWRLDRPQTIRSEGTCRLLAVLEGSIEVDGDPAGRPLSLGETMLLPATAGDRQLRPQGRAVFLEAYVPPR